MIIDRIENIDRYKGDPKLYRALKWMADVTLDNFPTEKVWVDGDEFLTSKLFFIPIKYQTKPIENCPIEAHEVRADIHYIMEGREGIEIADVRSMTCKGEFGANEFDYGEFEGETDGRLYLNPGWFAAIYPGEAHRVSIMEDEQKPVTKILAKMEA